MSEEKLSSSAPSLPSAYTTSRCRRPRRPLGSPSVAARRRCSTFAREHQHRVGEGRGLAHDLLQVGEARNVAPRDAHHLALAYPAQNPAQNILAGLLAHRFPQACEVEGDALAAWAASPSPGT